MSRRCPDRDVSLERVDYSSCTHGTTLRIEDPRSSGTLSKLGVGGKEYLKTFVCPDCGLVRFYAWA
jgi:hypothetical protein